MALEEGKTLLQTVSDGKSNFNLYYGNILYPVDSDGKEDRNNQVKIPDDQYSQILEAYLAEHKEAQKTETAPVQPAKPVQQPVQNTADSEKDVLQKQVAALQQQLQSLSKANATLQQEKTAANAIADEAKRQAAQAQSQLSQPAAPVQPKSEPTKPKAQAETEESDDEDDDEYEKGRGKGIKEKLTTLLLVFLMLLSAFQTFAVITVNKKINKMNSTDSQKVEEKTDKVNLTIDGETYQIDATQVQLEEGQTVVNVYGLMTTNKDGKKVNSVIPLGEIKVEQAEKAASEATATPEAEKTEAEQQPKRGKENGGFEPVNSGFSAKLL